MEEPQHPDTDELSLQDETDDRYVLSQIPTRKSYGIKQGVPLQYEYVKVSKGGADQTQEGWEKPSRKVRTRRCKADKLSLGVGHDENFYGALASDGDDLNSEPAEAESSVAEQAAGLERDDDCGLRTIQDPEDSKPSQSQSLVAEEDECPGLEVIGRAEATQGSSDRKQSAWDQNIWNPVDFAKAVWGSTLQEKTKDRQKVPERLQKGTPEPKPDASEQDSDDDGEGDDWMTTDSEQDSDDDRDGDEWADTVTTKPQLDASEQDSGDDGESDEWADAVSIQDVQPQDSPEAAVLEVADSEPKLSGPEVGEEQAAKTKKKKKNRKPKKKMEVKDTDPNKDTIPVNEVSPFKDTSPVKDAATRRYIADLTSRHRFVDPEGLSLAPEATLYHMDHKSEGAVPRHQIVALTLNECCVTAGNGEVQWVPSPMAKARDHMDLIYSDKTWSKKEQQIFWNKSPLARMLAAKRSYLPQEPRTDVISITLAFEDKEILRWPRGSTAKMLLWYGLVETQEIVFLWGIQQLRPLAEIEAEECAVYWSDLPEDVRKDWVLCSHDSTSDRLRQMMVACRNVNMRQASEAIVKEKNKLAQWKIIAKPGLSTNKEKLRYLVRAADEQTQAVATGEKEKTKAEASITRSAETQESEIATPLVPTADWFRPKFDVGFAVSSRMKGKAFRNDNLPSEDTEILTDPIQLSSRSRIIRSAVSRATKPKARTDMSQSVDQPSWSASFIQAGTQPYHISDLAATPFTVTTSTNPRLLRPSICSKERLPIS